MKKLVIYAATGVVAVAVIGAVVAGAKPLMTKFGLSGHQKSVASHPTVAATTGLPTVQMLSLIARERVISGTDAQRYFKIPVFNANGKKVTLDVKAAPVMFIASWDSTVLSQLHKQLKPIQKEPIFIAAQSPTEHTPQQEIADLKKALVQQDISSEVFALDGNWLKWTTGIPDTYIWRKDGKLLEVPGLLPDNQAQQWANVLK